MKKRYIIFIFLIFLSNQILTQEKYKVDDLFTMSFEELLNIEINIGTLTSMELSIDRKRIKFTVTDLSEIEGDTNMIRQVWINYISNAVIFRPSKRNPLFLYLAEKKRII